MLDSLATTAATAVSTALWVRRLRPASLSEAVLAGFVLFSAHVLLCGYALSYLGRLASLWAWAAGAGLALLAILALAALHEPSRRWMFAPPDLPGPRTALAWVRSLSPYQKALLGPPAAVAIALALYHAAMIARCAPHNCDSLNYHLPRMAHYLQQGNLDPFDTPYWAQVVHPKNATVLLAYVYLVTGRSENLTQLPQFISFGLAALAAYGIALQIGAAAAGAVFAALVFSLLTEALMQATTAQNDMMIATFGGTAFFFLLRFRQRPRAVYLVLAAASAAIAVGMKASAALLLPSWAVAAVFALRRPADDRRPFASLAVLGANLAVSIGLFVLPAGYLANLRTYGHLLGPESVAREHSFAGAPAAQVLHDGTGNLFRYAVDLLSLDGLPPVGPVMLFQWLVGKVVGGAARVVGIDLAASAAGRAPFELPRSPVAHEDFSTWGVLGVGAIWPAVLFFLLRRKQSAGGFTLAAATMLFFVVQAFAGPYDPWRGRYFLSAAVFAAPLAGLAAGAASGRGAGRRYWLVVTVLGCVSAATAVMFRADRAPFSLHSASRPWMNTQSVFAMDRWRQMTIRRPVLLESRRRFDETVPAGAFVAVYDPLVEYEWPLFGRGLARTIQHVYSFRGGARPIPPRAEYLVYAAGTVPAETGDLPLGGNWFLRRLDAAAPQPPAAAPPNPNGRAPHAER